MTYITEEKVMEHWEQFIPFIGKEIIWKGNSTITEKKFQLMIISVIVTNYFL